MVEVFSQARSMLRLFAEKRSEIPLLNEKGKQQRMLSSQITDELHLVVHLWEEPTFGMVSSFSG